MARVFRSVDWLRIRKGNEIYEGIEMQSYDPSVVVIKLDNGYNVGFRRSDVSVSREKREERTEKDRTVEEGEYDVSILGTGGTIASYVDYSTGAVHPARSTSELLRFIPEIKSIARVKADVLFSTFSENMECSHWMRIVEAVREEFACGAKGVVITHGTDTMCYTASALAFMLPQMSGPVILTGAQRSTDRPSSDGFLNLLFSVKLAMSDLGEVVIAMHESASDDKIAVHRATRVRKMHTSARDAFKTIGSEPLGSVDEGGMHLKGYRKKGEKTGADAKMNEKVSLVHFYPGMSESVFEAIADESDGIVIEGTGLGHTSEKLIAAIKGVIDEKKPVCMVSQCLYGNVNMNVYATGRNLLGTGVIPCADMLPEVAYVKLMWVLGHTKEPGEVREMMQRNIAHEMNERRVYEG